MGNDNGKNLVVNQTNKQMLDSKNEQIANEMRIIVGRTSTLTHESMKLNGLQ